MSECPSCGESFDSEHGVKVHHKIIHGESLSYGFRDCDECGDSFKARKKSERKYCSQTCSNRANAMYGEENPAKRDNVREKISKAAPGQASLTEQGRQAISKAAQTPLPEDHPFRNQGSDHPGSFASGGVPRAQNIEVEETGNTVKSSWEREIDLILHNSGIDYEYEPRRFELGDIGYYPDFIVGDKTVVEVKGYSRELCLEKARRFTEQIDMKYIVIQGDGERMESDEWLCWEERGRLLEVV